MKKYLLLPIIWVLGSAPICAQTDAYRNAINPVFQNLDKTPITTGLLLEYGVNLSEPEVYNGILSVGNIMTRTEWGLLYATMVTEKIKSTPYTLSAPNVVNNAIRSYMASESDKINISTLFYEYNKIKSNALSSNLLYISNNKLYDVSGRPSTPYENKITFAAAPTLNEVSGSIQTFKLRSALHYTNTTKTLSSRQVDLDDGYGYRTLAWDGEALSNYTTDGEKTIKVKFTYTDATVVYSHFKIMVTNTSTIALQAPGTTPSGSLFNCVFPHPNGNYTPQAFMGDFARGVVTVDLADGHTGIVKPLIIVEGFDPTNLFNYINLTRDGLQGLNIDLGTDFLYETLQDNPNNYDIVFLNFADGATFIQRNAFLLQQVIQWVNAEKAANSSTAKNAVMGFSMGGLVARYALADMEDRNIDHQTGLYVSMDTPHQGANVPVGLQAAFRHLSNIEFKVGILGVTPTTINLNDFVDLNEARAIFDSPAAQQLLRYYVPQSTSSLTIVSTEYDAFIQDLKSQGLSGSNGYPSRWGIRNVAIANGEECGGGLDFSAGSSLMNFNQADLGVAGGLVNYLLTFVSLNRSGRLISLTDWLSLGRELKFSFSARALPNQQTSQIYSGNIKIKKKILGLINQTTTLTSASLNSQASILPFDNSGGGIFSLTTFGGAQIPQQVLDFVDQESFSFIPLTSSLDIGGGNTALNSSDLYRAYEPQNPPSAPKNSPFSDFTTGFGTNENHTQLTYRSGNFLLDALMGGTIPVECQGFCTLQSAEISGSNVLCSTASTYSLPSLPSGTSINWSGGPNIQIVSSTGNSASIKTQGIILGGSYQTLSAQIITPCGNINISKQVWVGKPPVLTAISYNFMVDVPSEICYGPGSSYGDFLAQNSLFGTETIDHYEWQTDAGILSASTSVYPATSVTFNNAGNNRYIRVRSVNICGEVSAWYTKYFNLTYNPFGCEGGFGFGFTAYPNPTSSEFDVAITSNEETKKSNSEKVTEFEYSLINQNQKIVFTKKTTEKNIRIPAHKFPDGLYFLRVVYEGKSKTKQVIIGR
ncbi:MAG: hypothetical protein COW40_04975 [Cytophagales bacterium CG17_big_fil_post_rev_8_21_14_2_50_40_13]|nr:MAG: hypothetical protein COW40_04975 [Cytophagales bacterium CG17_big_fil_post_rev_8_21_14_2_50_40_13]